MNNQNTIEDVEEIRKNINFSKNTPIDKISRILVRAGDVINYHCDILDNTYMSVYEESYKTNWKEKTIKQATNASIEEVLIKLCAKIFNCTYGIKYFNPEQYRFSFKGHQTRVMLAETAYYAIHKAMDERCRKYIGKFIKPLHEQTIIKDSLARSYCELYGYVLYELTDMVNSDYNPWHKSVNADEWDGCPLDMGADEWDGCPLDMGADKFAALLTAARAAMDKDQNTYKPQDLVTKIMPEAIDCNIEWKFADLCSSLFNCDVIIQREEIVQLASAHVLGYKGKPANVLAAAEAHRLIRLHVNLKAKDYITYLQQQISKSLITDEIKDKCVQHYLEILAIKTQSAFLYRGIKL